MTRRLQVCLRIGVTVLVSLGIAGAAQADTGWRFAWFPFTLGMWYGHTLGPDRTVELRHVDDAISWRVKFATWSKGTFREQKGVIPLDAPAHCESLEIYTEGDLRRGEGDRFYRLGAGGHKSYDPPTRAENGAVEERLLASFERRAPKPPELITTGWAKCEAIGSACDGREASVALYAPYPDGYDMSIGARKQVVTCGRIEQYLDRCASIIADAAAFHAKHRERYEERLSCAAVAVVTRGDDDQVVELEVAALEGQPWGSARAEIDDRVDPSAWAFAPLTIVADIPFMVLHNTAMGLLSVFAVLPR